MFFYGFVLAVCVLATIFIFAVQRKPASKHAACPFPVREEGGGVSRCTQVLGHRGAHTQN